MDIQVLASGSHGNLYRISDGKTNLLIECGLPINKIKSLLNYELCDISGCLCSHQHLDHSKAANNLMKAGIDCYMSEETATALDLSGHRLHHVDSLKVFKIGTFSILPFETDHDCEGSLGFLIESTTNGEKLVFATDTYFIRYKFCGVQYYMIEANYDANILDANIESGLVPSEIKQRLQNSHFEISNVKEFFKKTDLSKCKGIHLIHLSKNNSDKELFEDEIKKITGLPVTAH